MSNQTYDVVVVGGGNAAVCAALGAAEKGAKVILLERSPQETRGGNSAFTGGAFIQEATVQLINLPASSGR